MKRDHYLRFIFIIIGVVCCITINNCFAQDKGEMKITIPFDSLSVDSIKATGNLKTGSLEITIFFHNNYAATANVSLTLGGFADFGFTDGKGKNYKIYTNSHLIGTQDINKGYLEIPFVQFGDKKFDWITMIQQNISPGQQKVLIVRVNKFDKDNKFIQEFHVRCILAVDLWHIGEELYQVENLPIQWK